MKIIYVDCEFCNGSGMSPDYTGDCERCDGTGQEFADENGNEQVRGLDLLVGYSE